LVTKKKGGPGSSLGKNQYEIGVRKKVSAFPEGERGGKRGRPR